LLFRFSHAARPTTISRKTEMRILMILCMPEKVSGGDTKFQGF
jgi:hypothetical protein